MRMLFFVAVLVRWRRSSVMWADGGEVGRAVASADAALVFVRDDIEHPMEGILDAPMLAGGASEFDCIRADRGAIEAGLAGGLLARFVALGLDRGDAGMAMLVRSGQAGWRLRNQAMSLVMQWRRISMRP